MLQMQVNGTSGVQLRCDIRKCEGIVPAPFTQYFNITTTLLDANHPLEVQSNFTCSEGDLRLLLTLFSSFQGKHIRVFKKERTHTPHFGDKLS
jgi:hypothetical protein